MWKDISEMDKNDAILVFDCLKVNFLGEENIINYHFLTVVDLFR